MEFNLLAEVIYLATSILSHGENWFKGMELDLEDYKILLKPHVTDKSEYLFPCKHLLKKHAPFMRLIIIISRVKGDFPGCIGTISGF